MGFMPIMLASIIPQLAPEEEAAAGAEPRSFSEPLSLPLLLRLRDSFT